MSELRQMVVERGEITCDGREKDFRSPELAGLLDAIRATAPTLKGDS